LSSFNLFKEFEKFFVSKCFVLSGAKGLTADLHYLFEQITLKS